MFVKLFIVHCKSYSAWLNRYDKPLKSAPTLHINGILIVLKALRAISNKIPFSSESLVTDLFQCSIRFLQIYEDNMYFFFRNI